MKRERERYQLVIGLGEGRAGKKLRELLEFAARHAADEQGLRGKPVSVWARDTLLREAGLLPYDLRIAAELEAVKRRFAELEETVSKIKIAEHVAKERAGKRRR